MAAKNHIQLIRGTTSKVSSYRGLRGELVIDIDKKTLRIHTGDNKAGGYDIASTIGNVTSATTATKDSDGNTISSTYAKLSGATFTGKTTAPTVSETLTNTDDIATVKWVATADCVVHTTGNETINGEKTFLKTIKGTAMNALWADLAENYESDFDYCYGTLVCFGGEREVTIAIDKVNGVVSRQPALLMNQEANNGLPIALAGRVDVLVKGTVKKFDNIVLSDIAGVGVVDNEAPVDLVIGKALQDKNTEDVETVLCVTKFNLL